MANTAASHRWTDADEIVALYLYLYGDTLLPLSKQEIPAIPGMEKTALPMRVANHRAVATGRGLTKTSKRTRTIFAQHHATPEPELRQLALRALGGTALAS